ncbi:hypothetical protein RJ035_000943 [Blastomyces gilchristii]
MPSVLLESYTGSNHSQGIAVGRLYRDIVGLSKRTKAKYSLLKQRLEGLISDLEQWHSIFDPSGYLLTRLVSGKVDDCTQADDYLSNYRELAGGSSLCLATAAQTAQTVLLDHTAYQDAVDPNIVLSQVKEISQLLSISDPFSLGFLKCLGVLRSNNRQFQCKIANQQITLSSNPIAPHRQLRAQEHPARNHNPAARKYRRNEPTHLIGFEQLQPSSGHSARFADVEYYKMQHNIYSLGVCLLEIGLWTFFVELASGSDEEPCPRALLDICLELGIRNKPQAALRIKREAGGSREN